MPIPLGILAVAGAGAGGGGDLDLLETTLISSNTASVTFSNLNNYSDYKHLQLRFTARTNVTGEANSSIALRFNSDTGSNYTPHRLIGNGSSVSTSSSTSVSSIYLRNAAGPNNSANIFGVNVVDILDFGSSSKNTTIRALSGVVDTASQITLVSGFWNNTAAVTSLSLAPLGGMDWVSGSRFSLYGIK